MAAAHLAQIALWAVAFLLCGQVSTLETAFCLSGQNCTPFGYGGVLLSERWRLLSPLEATNGLLFFGLSTAVLFAIMSQLIAKHLQNRDRVPERGSREPGASVGGRRRAVEVSTRILVGRTLVRRGERVTSSVTLAPAAVSHPAVNRSSGNTTPNTHGTCRGESRSTAPDRIARTAPNG